jgi:hypothetical protein
MFAENWAWIKLFNSDKRTSLADIFLVEAQGMN